MIAIFCLDELIINEIIRDRQIKIMHENDSCELSHVKILNERQIEYHCKNGDSFPARRDQRFEFEVSEELSWSKKKHSKKRLKGKNMIR